MMATPCEHFASEYVQLPSPAQNVYREDCTQCFGSIDDSEGLNVCLRCFNGFCTRHTGLHTSRQQHPLFLNIKRRKKHRDEPIPKLTKLAIAAESEEDRYESHYEVFCKACLGGPVTDVTGKVKEVVDAVIKAPTFARQAEVQAWEQEMTPCEHTLTLQQEAPRTIASQELGQCSLCDLKENLWLCLTCGNLGCGRSQFGSGVKGNSHALAHGTESNHPVAVKLGSISPEGTADIYCYSCNDERVDPDLNAHLAHFGIKLAEREKTEKSLTEMQIEQNLKWDFSMTTEDGQELRPLFGKGLTGLKNLGNSCYLSSTFQCLFSLPAFQHRYLPSSDPPDTSTPAEDLETQLQKLADGLLSGRWSRPEVEPVPQSEGEPQLSHQAGLAPSMLKHLIGRGHPEFSTMRQQDAFEFLLHVFKLITRSSQSRRTVDPTKSFQFQLEERLQCLACRKVRYRPLATDNIAVPVPARRILATGSDPESKAEFEPVPLVECLERFAGAEKVDLTCSSCGSKDGYLKRTMFKTFPETLAVNAQRFEIVNWVPTKLDIPVLVGDEPFSLDAYHSEGLKAGEDVLPDEPEAKAMFKPNEGALQQLEGMGFPRVRGEKALHATGNSDAEAAMNWLFAHMEDPDIDEPVELADPSAGSGGAGAGASISEDSLNMVIAMGIDPPKARKALKETGGDIERAVDWVFSHPDDPGEVDGDGSGSTSAVVEEEVPGSTALPANYRLKAIICHKGASIHAGHYVAFVRKVIEGEEEKGSQWVLFNDEKVVRAADVEEMKKFAYVYFFEKV